MRKRPTGRMLRCALFAALMAVGAQVMLPLPGIPANLTLLAVYLAAGLLGGWGAVTAAGVYLLLGAAGLPVFTGMTGGPGVLLGQTGGFLAGYVLCAGVSGWLIGRGGRLMPSLAAGTLCCYAAGTAWFMALTGAGPGAALISCVLPFVPVDAAKLLLAAVLIRRLQPVVKLMK